MNNEQVIQAISNLRLELMSELGAVNAKLAALEAKGKLYVRFIGILLALLAPSSFSSLAQIFQ